LSIANIDEVEVEVALTAFLLGEIELVLEEKPPEISGSSQKVNLVRAIILILQVEKIAGYACRATAHGAGSSFLVQVVFAEVEHAAWQ